MTGRNVQLIMYVEEEAREEAEPAVVLFQLTVVQTVRDMLTNHETATETFATRSVIRIIRRICAMRQDPVRKHKEGVNIHIQLEGTLTACPEQDVDLLVEL